MTTKAELIASVASQSGESNATVERVINATFESISAAMVGGQDVVIPKFGTFKVTPTAARQGRNPQTGASIAIAASRKASFKAASALKEAVKP